MGASWEEEPVGAAVGASCVLLAAVGAGRRIDGGQKKGNTAIRTADH